MTKTIEQEALDNPPAFPAGWPEVGYEPYYGMSLRDWFAGKALTGLMQKDPWGDPMMLASYAFNAADAMLATRGLKLVEAGDAAA